MSPTSSRRRWRWQQTTWGELASEFLGTFVLIGLGNSTVAMAVAALNQSGRGAEIFAASGDWLIIAFGWGIAATLAVYVAGGISGAHLNPAVSVGMAVFRGFAWRKVPLYSAAQVLGAFAASALVYLNYHDAIGAYEAANHIARGAPESAATFGIFATTPAPYFHSAFGPLVDQIIGTAFLVGCVLAITDELNTPPGANLGPVMVGGIILAIGIAMGANAGYAINPARDFGPRVFAWIAGWGDVAMPGDYGNVNGYLWVPIVGPLIGAVTGGAAYQLFIRGVLEARGTQQGDAPGEPGEVAPATVDLPRAAAPDVPGGARA